MIFKPLSMLLAAGILAGASLSAAEADFRPVKLEFPIERGSALDFSGHLDAPAGKYGFAYADNGVVRFRGNRQEFRGYGVNLCFGANYPDRNTADKMAEDIAGIGYNVVRIHHFDNRLADANSPDGTELNAEELDKLDYLIAKLKERGIYIIIDLKVSRKFKRGVIPEMPGGGNNKAIILLSDTALQNFRKFSENWLTHVNPYTGLALKDEPALLSIGYINELFLSNPSRFRDKSVKKLFNKRFAQWCEANGHQVTKKNRRRLELAYLNVITAKFYRETYRWLKDLGVKSMLAGESTLSSFAQAVPEGQYDMIDLHTYVGHPSFRGGWFKLPAKFMPRSMIHYYGHNAVVRALQRPAGAVLGVGEWDCVNPNPASPEGGFIIPAYGALHGWNMMSRFAYSHSLPDLNSGDAKINLFDICRDPLRRLSERAGVMFFLRGDVTESDLELPLVMRRDFLNYEFVEKTIDQFGYKEDWNSPALMKRMGLIGKLYLVMADPDQPPQLNARVPFLFTDASMLAWKNYAERPVINAYDCDTGLKIVAKSGKLGKGSIDLEAQRFVSSTGELVLDRGRECWQAVTPRSEAFLLEAGQKLTGNFAEAEPGLARAAILVGALDDRQLPESKRILILHLTTTRNAGAVYDDREPALINHFGQAPLLMQHGTARLSFKGQAADYQLYALALNGRRLGELKLQEVSPGRFGFTADNFRGTDAVAAYELIRR